MVVSLIQVRAEILLRNCRSKVEQKLMNSQTSTVLFGKVSLT